MPAARPDGGQAVVIGQTEAKSWTEGDELCREYLRERRMWFGTSTLRPGERGDIDPGHAASVEVFYCCQGRVVMNDGEHDYELAAGQAVIVPEGLPHALANVGDVTAVLVWAGAPGEEPAGAELAGAAPADEAPGEG